MSYRLSLSFTFSSYFIHFEFEITSIQLKFFDKNLLINISNHVNGSPMYIKFETSFLRYEKIAYFSPDPYPKLNNQEAQLEVTSLRHSQ